MHQNAGNCIYIFQNFLGEKFQTPRQNVPPTLKMLLTPLNKWLESGFRQYLNCYMTCKCLYCNLHNQQHSLPNQTSCQLELLSLYLKCLTGI